MIKLAPKFNSKTLVVVAMTALTLAACSKDENKTVDRNGYCTDVMVNNYNDIVNAKESEAASAACDKYLSQHGMTNCKALLSGTEQSVSYANIQPKCEAAKTLLEAKKAKAGTDNRTPAPAVAKPPAFSVADANGDCTAQTIGLYNNVVNAKQELIARTPAPNPKDPSIYTKVIYACRAYEKSFADSVAKSCQAQAGYRSASINGQSLSEACEIFEKLNAEAQEAEAHKNDKPQETIEKIVAVEGADATITLAVLDDVTLTKSLRPYDQSGQYFSLGKAVKKGTLAETLKKQLACAVKTVKNSQDFRFKVDEVYKVKKASSAVIDSGELRSYRQTNLQLTASEKLQFAIQCLSNKKLTTDDLKSAFKDLLKVQVN